MRIRPRTIVLILALLALAAKIYCASNTVGSTDVITFYNFGKAIHDVGLIPLYRFSTAFNHTPLVGEFSSLAYTLADNGHSNRLFAYFLRLPGIMADLVAFGVLLWVKEKTGRPSWWALGLFAASPVAFMVSGFHGNVDSVMALFVLLAGLACVFERPDLCGLFLGLGCNIKIIPIFLGPAFFFHWWSRRQSVRFALPAAGLVLAGWSYPLLTIPAVFLKDVLGYSSIWGVWGLSYLLRKTGLPFFQEINYTNEPWAQNVVTTGLKLLIVAGVIILAWRRRNTVGRDFFTVLALSWAIFFVFAPGFGAQYLVWLAPCFLLASDRWYGFLTAASSVALFVFYTVICHGLPWMKGFTVHTTEAGWTPWLLLPWGTLAAYLWSQRADLFRPAEIPAQPASASPAPVEQPTS